MKPTIIAATILAIGYVILRADQRRNDASTAAWIGRNLEAARKYTREQNGITQLGKVAVDNIRKANGL